MHWLPLVAMVIASALPFPHSPVSTTVAAMTEPGTSPDSRRKDRNDSSNHLTAPAQPHGDYSSHRKVTQKDHKVVATLGTDTSTQSQGSQYNTDYIKAFTRRGLSTNKGKNLEESLQSNSNLAGDDTNDIRSDVHTAGERLETSSSNRQEDTDSQENFVPEDYVLDSSRTGGDAHRTGFDVKETHPNSVDSRTAVRENVRFVETSNVLSHTAGLQSPGERDTLPSPVASDSTETGTLGKQGAEGVLEQQQQPEEALEPELGLGIMMDSLQDVDDLTFLDAHPRVLFSPSPSPPKHPPLLLMLENGMVSEPWEADTEEEDEGAGDDGHIEGHGDRESARGSPLSWADAFVSGSGKAARPVGRNKRSHLSETGRGERSVCESESVWVTDKEIATDIHGQTVTILPTIQTHTGPLKQYFYETRCRKPELRRDTVLSRGSRGAVASAPQGVAGAGCLGVDKKQWVSECKSKHSFVRALTKDSDNRMGWRWIRIESACVCVLLRRAARH